MPVLIFFSHVHEHPNAADALGLLSACIGYPRGSYTDCLDEIAPPHRLGPLGKPKINAILL